MSEGTVETNELKKLGIIIGRFQPLHNGHCSVIEKAIGECESVLILLGSANKPRDFNNPFLIEERMEMLQSVYCEVPKVRLVPLDDNPNMTEWVASVYAHGFAIAGDIDPSLVTLYTGEKDKGFYEAMFMYTLDTTVSPKDLSGTTIREHLYNSRGSNVIPKTPENIHKLLGALYSTKGFARLGEERLACTIGKHKATQAHAFKNPIEPVVHAAVMRAGKVLLVQRNSVRGYGQWAIPGGFLEHGESTQAGALRELREETGVDLAALGGAQLAQCVEENLDDLSTRTLGINYLFGLKDDVEVEVIVDPEEVLAYEWVNYEDIVTEQRILFYNHNLVLQRLLATVGVQGE